MVNLLRLSIYKYIYTYYNTYAYFKGSIQLYSYYLAVALNLLGLAFFRSTVFNMFKRSLKYFFVYIGMILVFLFLLTLSNVIPKEKLIANVNESAAQLYDYTVFNDKAPHLSDF